MTSNPKVSQYSGSGHLVLVGALDVGENGVDSYVVAET